MADHTHLCTTCKLAIWQKTANGRHHPNGQGRCGWTPPHIQTPAAWKWGYNPNTQPKPVGGHIERAPHRHVTKCEVYESAAAL